MLGTRSQNKEVVKATIVKARTKRSFIINDGFRKFIGNRRFLRPRSNTETEVSLVKSLWTKQKRSLQ